MKSLTRSDPISSASNTSTSGSAVARRLSMCSWILLVVCIWTKKRWAAKPTSGATSRAADEVLAVREYSPASGFDQNRYGPVIDQFDGHACAEAAALRAEGLPHAFDQRLRVLRPRCVDEAGPVSPARVAVHGEVGDDEQLTADVAH